MYFIQPRENWTKPSRTSSYHVVGDLTRKGYLSREEALRYQPLARIQHVVSMWRSLIKVLGKLLGQPY